jgi:hypothetical protein
LVECVVSNDEAPGSKPGFSTFSFIAEQEYHKWKKLVLLAGVEPATSGT